MRVLSKAPEGWRSPRPSAIRNVPGEGFGVADWPLRRAAPKPFQGLNLDVILTQGSSFLSQPWAGGCNPFGIGNADEVQVACCRTPHGAGFVQAKPVRDGL